MLISNIRFKERPVIDEFSERTEYLSYEIDMQSIFGGNFVLEDISYLIGIYDRHIPGTEDDYDGPKFNKEDTQYMYGLYDFIVDNIENIEELVHQFCTRGGLKPGTYSCLSHAHIWKRED